MAAPAIATRPRILHLVPADGIGGVEVAAKSMAARTDLPCSFRLQFIEPAAPEGRTAASLLRMLASHRRALRPALAFAPDLIICSLWRSVPLALTLRALRPRVKLVYFLHLDTTTHRLDALLSAMAMRAADAIWADSAAALAARGAAGPRDRAISFVTERVALTDKPFVGPRFVSWGRLNRQKGFDRAIRFVAGLVRRGIDAHYAIYGPDDGEREVLQALIDKERLEEHVRLMGPVARDTLASVAASNAFFLQPSRSEGMCMAAVEAMQHGLVPIATPVGELARYVVPRKTGVIIDPDDLGPAMNEAAALIADPQQWRGRSIAAMRYWHDAALYADDVCRAACNLAGTSS